MKHKFTLTHTRVVIRVAHHIMKVINYSEVNMFRNITGTIYKIKDN